MDIAYVIEKASPYTYQSLSNAINKPIESGCANKTDSTSELHLFLKMINISMTKNDYPPVSIIEQNGKCCELSNHRYF